MSCVVCGKASSFWFSSHMFFMRTVGYCGPTCRLISNRLWVYIGSLVLIGIGVAIVFPILAIAGVIGLLIGFYASSQNKRHRFPLFNFESILDNY